MNPRFLDTFSYEAVQGGIVTFEDADPPEPHARWMRSQYRVGHRVGELPLAIEVAHPSALAASPVALTRQGN